MKDKRVYLKGGALTAPLPPAMVTVGDMESSNVLTVAWTGILSTVPPRTYISVRPSRHSYGMLLERGEFVINLPSEDMARTVDFVGIYTGAKMDKFERCGLTRIKSKEVAAPTIAECPFALECRVTEVIKMGSHDVFIADIVSTSASSEIMDGDGKLRLDRAGLLAYAHGEYFALGEKLGRFGFSTDKEGQGGERVGTRGSGKVKVDKEPSKKSGSVDSTRGLKRSEGESLGEKKGAAVGTRAEKADIKDKKEPFYKGMPRGKARAGANKDKGKPHGKRTKGSVK